MDFLLNDKNDFVLTNGSITFADPAQEGLQKNRQRLLFIFGEYFLDDQLGIPYFEYIFQKPIRIEEVDLLMKREIQRIPGNIELLSYASSVDPVKRSLKVQYSVLTSSGPISVSFDTAAITTRR